MKPPKAAVIVARIIGALTLGWVYLAVTDLLWLLHFHAVHSMLTKAPIAFNYGAYLACNYVNIALPAIASFALLIFPARLLRAMAPEPASGRSVSAGWVATGVAIGLILFVLGAYEIMATTLWTIYQGGKDSGWQIELFVYVLIAAGGVYLCRRMLASRQEG